MLRSLCNCIVVLSFLWLQSCRGPEGPAGPQGISGGGIESLTDPNIQPKVIYTNPPANSRGPYGGFYRDIIIRFNKVMDISSVRRGIALSSTANDVHIDSNSVFSEGGDIFRVSVVPVYYDYGYWRWKIGQTYTLALSSSIKDINGNRLLLPYSLDFMPEPNFRVRSIFPAFGAEDINAGVQLTLYLNSSVDTSIRSHISIVPPVTGRWEHASYYYEDSAYLSFNNSGFFENGVLYTITIDGSAQDKEGNRLPQEFRSSFRTADFRVESTYPRQGSSNVELFNNISASFTNFLDTSTIRPAFTILPFVDGELQRSYYSLTSSFYFYTYRGLAPETHYTVTIDSSIRSRTGTKLQSPYQFSFTTAPFQMRYSSPYDGEVNVSTQIYNINVSFNASLDSASKIGAFSFKDDLGNNVPGILENYYSTSNIIFIPSSRLKPKTNYVIRVSTSLKTKSGYNLKSPITISFLTGD